jgi:NAD(P)-dependent dehydrogenase (short-subunit alcohol dehydrogenase family)
MEGNFTADRGKTGKHPHTNMAKAAMNMITRTCAESYARRGVWMNSVDPGWVSNEAPTPSARAMEQAGFREPLDLVDAAARVLDPVFVGISTGVSVFGKLFKDYREVPW